MPILGHLIVFIMAYTLVKICDLESFETFRLSPDDATKWVRVSFQKSTQQYICEPAESDFICLLMISKKVYVYVEET